MSYQQQIVGGYFLLARRVQCLFMPCLSQQLPPVMNVFFFTIWHEVFSFFGGESSNLGACCSWKQYN